MTGDGVPDPSTIASPASPANPAQSAASYEGTPSRAQAQADPPPQRSREGGQNRKSGRHPDGSDNRKRRSGGNDRRDQNRFGDGIERAACLRYIHHPPPAYPVQHRTGVAALISAVVDRRPNAVLLCDCDHDGPHYWPNGDPVEASER